MAKTPVLAPIVARRRELFPLLIFSNYRGNRIEALVKASGEIQFAGEAFASPSAAATAARQKHGYAGKGAAATNGWDFWRFKDTDGRAKQLGELRTT